MKVTYGSAQLTGLIYEDWVCLNYIWEKPGPILGSANALEKTLRENKCTKHEMFALNEAKGLEKDFHGILGLSPKKDENKKKQHLLWSLKHGQLIERAMVSFSINGMGMKDQSYALFGGFNSTQIVNGAKGLKTFKVYPNGFKTWGLLGQGVTYGGNYVTDISGKKTHSAILDTGDSQLSVPVSVFE